MINQRKQQCATHTPEWEKLENLTASELMKM